MLGMITQLIINTIAILTAAYLIPDVYVENMLVAFTVSIVLGVLNTFVKPILKILTFPITVVTLGLFLIVINVFLVLLAAYIVPGFDVYTYLAAFLFALITSLVSSFLSKLK